MNMKKAVLIAIAVLCIAAFALVFVSLGFEISDFLAQSGGGSFGDSLSYLDIFAGLLAGVLAVLVLEAIARPRRHAALAMSGALAAVSLLMVLSAVIVMNNIAAQVAANPSVVPEGSSWLALLWPQSWYFFSYKLAYLLSLGAGIWAAVYLGCRRREKLVEAPCCCGCTPEEPAPVA
jgi:uncharacterized membrane protein